MRRPLGAKSRQLPSAWKRKKQPAARRRARRQFEALERRDLLAVEVYFYPGSNIFNTGEHEDSIYDAIEVTIIASGQDSSSTPITVKYSIGGNATNESDYYDWYGEPLSGEIEIPAGHCGASLFILPHDDNLKEGDETIILTLDGGAGYTVGSPDEAIITIVDNDPTPVDKLAICTCPCTCAPGGASDVLLAQAFSQVAGDVGPVQLLRSSRDMERPVLRGGIELPASVGTADSMEVTATMGGWTTLPVYYDPASVVADAEHEFAIPFVATALSAGKYDYDLEVKVWHGGSSTTYTHSGKYYVEKTFESPFSDGWELAGWDRLSISGSGAYLQDAIGTRNWFNASGGNYQSEAGDGGLSLTTISGGYRVTDRDGNQREFNSTGQLTLSRDFNGNETIYNYTDADGDLAADDLTSITDAVGRTTTFAYTGSLITSITGDDGQVHTLDYDVSDRLETITQPDPDGIGAQTAGQTSFVYGTGNRITSYTNANAETTAFTYGQSGTVLTRTDNSSVVEEFSPFYTAGVVDTSSGLGSSLNPASLVLAGTTVATYEHPSLGTITTKHNRFGQVIESEDDDGNVTTYQRDGQGRVTTEIGPDPDGVGPLTSPVTQYEYDARGNLLQVIYPDGSNETWTYDNNTSQNVPLTYVNQSGHTTLYTYDMEGNPLSITQVVDGGVNDVVTEFTYTGTPATSAFPPRGLVATMTDPLGHVTAYAYNHRGLLIGTTYALGETEQASIELDYDSSDRLQYLTDELGRVTEYVYDALDRVTKVILPDPDGAGAQTSPEFRYQYDAAGRLKAEVDPLNRQTIYTYNARGELTKVERPDHDGNSQLTTTEFGYNSAGLRTSVTDPLGRVITSVYNTLGQLIEEILPDPDGVGAQTAPETGYTYDGLGRILTATDALNNVTSYAYANFGRVVTITSPDPDGVGAQAAPVTELTYDAMGQLVSVEDALGRVTTYEYDALGRKIKETLPDPDGAGPLTAPVTEWEYDKAGNLRFATDPLGNITEYQYDARHRLVKTIQPDPDGVGTQTAPETVYAYDDAGQLTSVTDALGRVTSYDYDDLGRLIKVTQPDPDGVGGVSAPETLYAYDAAGRKTSMTDALGNVTNYEYDLLDNLVEVTQPDPDGAGPLTAPVTTWAYDAAGQLLSTADPLSRVTSYEYDALGRTTKVTLPDPDGAGAQLAPWTVYTYDAVGNLLTATDRLSHATTYAYDHLYRQTSVTNANSEVTAYTYDAVGNRLTLTDPESNTTTWVYDGLNRITTETNELSAARSFEYDLVGNLTKKTDRLNRVTEYTYDHLHRRTAEIWKSGGSTVRTLSYDYDAASQLLSASDPAASYDFVYDELGRATEITADIDGLIPDVVLSQAFDLAGNRTQLAAEIGGTDDFVNDFTYDDLHRLTRLTQQDQSGGNVLAEKRFDFAYNALGQQTLLTRYADVAGAEMVASTTSSYDFAHRLTSLAHAQGVTALASYDYTYDVANRITSIGSLLDGLTEYNHDDTNQLTGADHTGQTDESYTYDDNGNRIMSGYTVGTNNRITSDGTYDYEYDAEGNLTAKETIATGEREEYAWDHRNRLISVTFKDGSANVVKKVEQTYDLFNRWVRSQVDADGDLDFDSQRFFAYDGNQIIVEFDGSTAADLVNRYVWSYQVDQLLAVEQVTSLAAAGTVVYALTDHLGTTRDLAAYDVGTDATSIANHRRFDSFGNLVSETNGSVTILIGFTGRPFDEATDKQWNLHRWYISSLGVWMSEDPIGFAAGDANLRKYVGHAPVEKSDPSGLIDVDAEVQRRLDAYRGSGVITLALMLRIREQVLRENGLWVDPPAPPAPLPPPTPIPPLSTVPPFSPPFGSRPTKPLPPVRLPSVNLPHGTCLLGIAANANWLLGFDVTTQVGISVNGSDPLKWQIGGILGLGGSVDLGGPGASLSLVGSGSNATSVSQLGGGAYHVFGGAAAPVGGLPLGCQMAVGNLPSLTKPSDQPVIVTGGVGLATPGVSGGAGWTYTFTNSVSVGDVLNYGINAGNHFLNNWGLYSW